MKNTKTDDLEKGVKTSDKPLKVDDEISIKSKDGLVQVEVSQIARQKTTGFKTDATTYILNATLSAIGQGLSEKGIAEKGEQILLSMGELSPKDGFEGILISQMLTAYDQAMKCFMIADLNIKTSKIYEKYMNQGIKLMRLYNQQLETLDKHRNKGRQRMTVEHVHVHEGGQAIVGEVHQGEGVTNER